MPDHSTADADLSRPPAAASVEPRIGSAWRTVSILTLASRLTGLARDAACSRLFGVGPVWSAFAFAFLIPNLFRRLFGEGALAAAFLPEYARLAGSDPDKARRYAGAVLRLLLLVLGGATIVGEAVVLLLLLTPLGETGGLALGLMLLTLPFTPMVCASAILGAALQTRDRFAVPAAAPIVLNVLLILAAISARLVGGLEARSAIYAVAAAVPIAGVMQLIWAWRAIGRDRPELAAARAEVRDELTRTLRRMAPVAVGMSALQINSLIDGVIASWPVLFGPYLPISISGEAVRYPLDEAANATLFFAQRLYQFPLGVFGIAIATAVFPALARAAQDSARFASTLARGVRLSLFIGVPASLGLVLVRDELVAVIYLGGAFDEAAITRVAVVLLGYAPGVWAFGLIHVLTRGFYARGDTRTPVRIALVSIACNTVLSLALIWFLREAALAWATSACAIGQAWALARLSRREQPEMERVGPAVSRVMLASAGMAVAVLALGAVWPGSSTWIAAAGRLSAMVAVGAGAFAVAAWRLCPDEWRELISRRTAAPAPEET